MMKNREIHKRKRIKTSSETSGRNHLLSGVIFFLLITVSVYLLVMFITSPRFSVDEFQIIGNRSIPKEDIVNIINNTSSENIFALNNDLVEVALVRTYPYFSNVSVKKFWPNKLLVKVNEQEPQFVIVNLNGSYLINEQGEIIQVIAQNPVSFSNENILIAVGLGDVNYDEVKKRVKSQWQIIQETENIAGESTEEETIDRSTSPEPTPTNIFNYDKIDIQTKKNALENLKEESNQAALNLFHNNTENLRELYPSELTTVLFYDNYTYLEGDNLDQEKVLLTKDVQKLFKQNEIIVKNIYWEGRYLVEFELEDGTRIIFGTKRSTSNQFEDLLIVLNQLKSVEQTYEQIDLSATKISVK